MLGFGPLGQNLTSPNNDWVTAAVGFAPRAGVVRGGGQKTLSRRVPYSKNNFQVYSLVQLVCIVEEEAREGTLFLTYQASNQSSSGSVIHPAGIVREELRVFHSLLLIVFSMVLFSCLLLILGICKVGVWRNFSPDVRKHSPTEFWWNLINLAYRTIFSTKKRV